MYELDIFGSDRIDSQQIMSLVGPKINKWVDLWAKQKVNSWDLNDLNAAKIKLEIEEEIKSTYNFAYVLFTGIHYVGVADFVIIDVVEKDDASRRMPFSPSPINSYTIPKDIFKDLHEYEALGMQLFQQGKLSIEDLNDSGGCFHATFGHRHPLLASYLSRFRTIISKYLKDLENIFLYNADDKKRADAVFILAYMEDGIYLVNLLKKGLRDNSPDVRNNIMRVFTLMAKDYPDIVLPLDDIIEALDYPSFFDRNKAVSILWMYIYPIERLDKYREKFLKAAPQLIKLLSQKEPNVRDPAYDVLKALSGKDFECHDYSAWKTWIQSIGKLTL